jgi:hypothetical protein
LEESNSTLLPPPSNSEDKGPEKKQKCTKELTSLGTSNPTYVSQEPAAANDSDLQIFELLDS